MHGIFPKIDMVHGTILGATWDMEALVTGDLTISYRSI